MEILYHMWVRLEPWQGWMRATGEPSNICHLGTIAKGLGRCGVWPPSDLILVEVTCR